MATFHILNGDCLTDQLRQTKINQNFIICRECLIEGDLYADNINDFWTIRAKFISDTYKSSTNEYYAKTVSEFEKLYHIPDKSEVCLWFENDLFCQTNMWFVISILAKNPTLKVFRAFPILKTATEKWKGFGISETEDLEHSYSSKVEFKPMDIELGENLWNAYRQDDFDRLYKLAKSKSDCFEFLEEVCNAHIERFTTENVLGRPQKTIKEIIEEKSDDFQTIFSEFSNREGIYGFGDTQVKNIYDKMHSP